MVVVPARHIVSLAELWPDEAQQGPLLTAVSSVVIDVTGSQQVYLALFAEAEGFQHLHIRELVEALQACLARAGRWGLLTA
jgi:hypothetical protein